MFSIKLQSQQLPSDSFMDHATCCTCRADFSCELSYAIWKNDIREIANLNFFQLYHIFLLLWRSVMMICYEELIILCYKELIIPVFFEGHIKTMKLCTTE